MTEKENSVNFRGHQSQAQILPVHACSSKHFQWSEIVWQHRQQFFLCFQLSFLKHHVTWIGTHSYDPVEGYSGCWNSGSLWWQPRAATGSHSEARSRSGLSGYRYTWLVYFLQLYSSHGISPMGNSGRLPWGKPAVTVTLPNLRWMLGILVFP